TFLLLPEVFLGSSASPSTLEFALDLFGTESDIFGLLGSAAKPSTGPGSATSPSLSLSELSNLFGTASAAFSPELSALWRLFQAASASLSPTLSTNQFNK